MSLKATSFSFLAGASCAWLEAQRPANTRAAMENRDINFMRGSMGDGNIQNVGLFLAPRLEKNPKGTKVFKLKPLNFVKFTRN